MAHIARDFKRIMSRSPGLEAELRDLLKGFQEAKQGHKEREKEERRKKDKARREARKKSGKPSPKKAPKKTKNKPKKRTWSQERRKKERQSKRKRERDASVSTNLARRLISFLTCASARPRQPGCLPVIFSNKLLAFAQVDISRLKPRS